MSIQDRMIRLAMTFPTLANAAEEGVLRFCEGWSAERLERWAYSSAASDGGRFAAQFVLGVWNKHQIAWACGKFDLHVALSRWDDEHRAAFLAWASDPWWA